MFAQCPRKFAPLFTQQSIGPLLTTPGLRLGPNTSASAFSAVAAMAGTTKPCLPRARSFGPNMVTLSCGVPPSVCYACFPIVHVPKGNTSKVRLSVCLPVLVLCTLPLPPHQSRTYVDLSGNLLACHTSLIFFSCINLHRTSNTTGLTQEARDRANSTNLGMLFR